MANVRIYELSEDTTPAADDYIATDKSGDAAPSKVNVNKLLLSSGTITGSASQAQSFGATGIKADVIAESTGAAGVTVDGVLLKDGGGSFTTGIVINESGADSDTRIEGDTETNLFFVDASADRIGIGTATPVTRLHVRHASATGPLSGVTGTLSFTGTGSANASAFEGSITNDSSGTIGTAVALSGSIAANSGTITTATALQGSSLASFGTTVGTSYGIRASSSQLIGTMTASYGIYATSYAVVPGFGAITTGYGIYAYSRDAATNYALYTDGGTVFVKSYVASEKGLVLKAAASQTANMLEVQNSSGTAMCSIDKLGAFSPASMADSSAPNNSIYYSTTASKLVYKDSGGTVNNLY